MREPNSTPWRLLTSLQTVLWAVLASCLGSAWGSRPSDTVGLHQVKTEILSELAEDQRFYFNARFYDAERGSFIGRDPKLQFWSPYLYVGNGPLVGVDPTGEETHILISENGPHASFYVERDGDFKFMWDGYGGYHPARNEENPRGDRTGSSDVFGPWTSGFSVAGYIKYQLMGSEKVTDYTFNTTIKEEGELFKAAMQKQIAAPFMCAFSSSDILSSVDLFGRVFGAWDFTPGGMKSNLDEVWASQSRYNSEINDHSIGAILNVVFGRALNYRMTSRVEYLSRGRTK